MPSLNLKSIFKQQIILSFLWILFFDGFGQPIPPKKVYIEITEFKNIHNDTLADGSNVYLVENIDSNFRTSIALLPYYDLKEIIHNRVIKKNKINFNQLLDIIKNNKNGFSKEYTVYIIEKNKKRGYRIYKVYDEKYIESNKSIDDIEILDDFL